MARNSRQLARRDRSSTEVSPLDEPSAEWGWHGGFPKGTIAGGVITILLCVAFFFGPYQSRTQDLWLAGVIVVIIGGIIGHVVRRRNAWRR